MNSMFDRGAAINGNGSGPGSLPLPLNLIAVIISYLGEPGDLARACRTCRVLHYMTIPQLYSNVSLHSYDRIRFSPLDGKPEGCGGPSPFFMALNALVTRNVAGYVKKFKVYGTWKEYDLEECAKVGRVPDGSMMINTLIRAAVDRMPSLESFSWELNTKMLPTVWMGLVQRPNLLDLTVRFPGTRFPRPTLVVPPIPKLVSLKLTDIDPLCYPDDVSLLLLGSKNLRALKMHWSSRMREAREPSVHLSSYFGRCVAMKYKLPLKILAFHNLYAQHDSVVHDLLDTTVEEFTMINSATGAGDSADMSFIDYSWRTSPPNTLPPFKMIRDDKISTTHCSLLGRLKGLERYYLITGRKLKAMNIDSSTESTPANPCAVSVQSPATPDTPADPSLVSLGASYLDNIFKGHGSTLRHLLLKPQWRLSSAEIARLVHSCPALEQLGLGLEIASFDMFRLLLPFLPRLFAIRILEQPDESSLSDRMLEKGIGLEERLLGKEALERDWKSLRWVGVRDFVFEVYKSEVIEEIAEDGTIQNRRKVMRRPLDAVKDVEIWSLDRLEI